MILSWFVVLFMRVNNMKLYIQMFAVVFLTLTFSTTTLAFNYYSETYTGVINIHQEKNSDDVDATNQQNYFLHLPNKKPLKLIFKNGGPLKPILTGDKVSVIGLNDANRLFVEAMQPLHTSSLPF